MKSFRHPAFRLLWGLMALFFLNGSIDTPDINPSWIEEDLSINDQESLLELICESFLGYEEAFEEYDDMDSQEDENKSSRTFDWNASETIASLPFLNGFSNLELFKPYQNPNFSAALQRNTPPPKA